MKKLILAAVMAVSAVSVVVTDADARRLGSGGNSGRQSQSFNHPSPMQAPRQATAPSRPAAPAAAPGARPSTPWGGILGGAALGLGLGAMMSSFGMGGGGTGGGGGMLGSLLMFALLGLGIFFAVRMFKRRAQSPGFAGSGATAFSAEPQAYAPTGTPEIASRVERPGYAGSAGYAPETEPVGVPADFDVKGFERHAKTYFIRLQAAWDTADIDDIREFTTPEMFAELRLQIQERGASPNTTDVVSLQAELLGIENASEHYLASLKFEGLIREAPDAPTAPFTEIWNLLKPVSGGGGWVLAGIQQIP